MKRAEDVGPTTVLLAAASVTGFYDGLFTSGTSIDGNLLRVTTATLVAVALVLLAGAPLLLASRLGLPPRLTVRAVAAIPIALVGLRSSGTPGPSRVALMAACWGLGCWLLHVGAPPVRAFLAALGPAWAVYFLTQTRRLFPAEQLAGEAILAGVAGFVVACALGATRVALLAALIPVLGESSLIVWRARGEIPAARSADRPNVLLVVLDAARGDLVAQPGGPLLEALPDAARFTRAVAASQYTFPSHAALFTGLTRDALPASNQLPPGAQVIAARFRGRGYHTSGFSGNFGLLGPGYGFERGFDRYVARPDALFAPVAEAIVLRSPVVVPEWHRIGRHRSAGSLLRDAEHALAEGPAFVFVNLFEAHEYHSPWRRRIMGDRPPRVTDPASTRRAYLSAARAVEADLAAFLRRLRASGALERTWIVITSDHGERLGEDGMGGHLAGTGERLIHIPLVIRPPGAAASSVETSRVGHVDVFRLLSAISDGDSWERWRQGLPRGPRLLSMPEGSRPCPPALVVYDEDWKYVRDGATESVFDLQADPTGSRPVPIEQVPPARAAAWRVQADVQFRCPPASRGRDTDERLKALGYVN